MKKESAIPEGFLVKRGTVCKVISTVNDESALELGEIVTWCDDFESTNCPLVKHKNGNIDVVWRSNLKIIKNKKAMQNNKTKTTKKKAQWKIGDVVYNDYNSQKSKVLAVAWDAEDEMYKYTLQCLDDSGSLHLIYEESISEVEVVKMTVSELKEYYEESENCEVTITK